MLAGPTNDYGYTNFGSDVTTKGYVAETPTAANTSCSNDGTCTYTFTHAIPADARGTYSIGIEGRATPSVINAGTTKETTVQYGADNKVINFSVDGSPINAAAHGGGALDLQQLPLAPVAARRESQPDRAVRALPQSVDGRFPGALHRHGCLACAALPPQGVNFAYMIHNIHTGESQRSRTGTYVVIGNGGSVNRFQRRPLSFDEPDRRGRQYPNCHMCHVNTPSNCRCRQSQPGQQSAGPDDHDGTDHGGLHGCHGTPSAVSHASLQTSGAYGESCDVCHGTGAEFDVEQDARAVNG